MKCGQDTAKRVVRASLYVNGFEAKMKKRKKCSWQLVAMEM